MVFAVEVDRTVTGLAVSSVGRGNLQSCTCRCCQANWVLVVRESWQKHRREEFVNLVKVFPAETSQQVLLCLWCALVVQWQRVWKWNPLDG